MGICYAATAAQGYVKSCVGVQQGQGRDNYDAVTIAQVYGRGYTGVW